MRPYFFLLRFKLIIFFYLFFRPLAAEYSSFCPLGLDFTLSFAVINKARGKDGKFISVPSINLEPLDPTLKEALIGELLGDGCLRYTRKVQEGKPNTN